MSGGINTSIFQAKPRFLGIFFFTSLLGLLLICIAIYRASMELEILHQAEDLQGLIGPLMDDENLRNNLIQHDKHYSLFLVTPPHFKPLHIAHEFELPFQEVGQLEATRFTPNGGYFEQDEKTHVWTTVQSGQSGQSILIVYPFESRGQNALAYVYQHRLIIPMLFYLWLMSWVAVFFKRLAHKLKIVQAEMQQLALNDPLTGLPNRHLLNDRLTQLMHLSQREKTSFACALVDLDDFKAINDNLGHNYGDEALVQAGHRISALLRDSDTVIRFGGDEFVVLIYGVDAQNWHMLFTRLLTELRKPYVLLDKEVFVGVSIGVSISQGTTNTAKSLINQADKSMYRAKLDGGGVCLHDSGELRQKAV